MIEQYDIAFDIREVLICKSAIIASIFKDDDEESNHELNQD
jgi:hypothetical protein